MRIRRRGAVAHGQSIANGHYAESEKVVILLHITMKRVAHNAVVGRGAARVGSAGASRTAPCPYRLVLSTTGLPPEGRTAWHVCTPSADAVPMPVPVAACMKNQAVLRNLKSSEGHRANKRSAREHILPTTHHWFYRENLLWCVRGECGTAAARCTEAMASLWEPLLGAHAYSASGASLQAHTFVAEQPHAMRARPSAPSTNAVKRSVP